MDVIATGAGLAVLMIALFAWLRADIGRLETRLTARGEEREARLTTRGEELEARLTARSEELEARLTARIEGVETRIEGVESSLEGIQKDLSTRIDRVERSNIDLRERMARIEGMLDGLRDSIAGRDRRDAA